MKVWKFYKIPEDIDSTMPLYDKYQLYGITNDKKIAKQFKEERNMKVFIVSTCKMTQEEYAEFANQNRSSVLEPRDFLTVDKKYTEKETRMNVTIITTFGEYMISKDYQHHVQEQSFWTDEIGRAGNPSIFNENIRAALDYLDYSLNYKIYMQNYDVDDPAYDDYNAPDWWTDELAVIFKLYGHLFFDIPPSYDET